VLLVAGALASCSSSSSGTPPEGSDDGSVLSDGAATNGDAPSGSSGGALADGTASGSGGGDAAADGPAADGGACQLPPEAPAPSCFTSFVAVGPTMVTTVCSSATAPQGQGGSIPDGVYSLASRLGYGSSCLPTPAREGAIVICGGVWDWVEIYEPDADGQVSATYAYRYAATQPQASSVTLTPQCTSDSSNTVEDLTYTFAAGQLTLYSPASASTFVMR
jgi:hypothetical protein